jgi:hypothetical protein
MPRTLPKVNEWSEKDNRVFKVIEVVPARIIPASVVLEGNGEQVTLSVADYLNTHKRMVYLTTRSRKKVEPVKIRRERKPREKKQDIPPSDVVLDAVREANKHLIMPSPSILDKGMNSPSILFIRTSCPT